MIEKTIEYQMISTHYGNRTTGRSNVPLINHIHEGIYILKLIKADLLTQQAFCLHPLFQNDEAFVSSFSDLNLSTVDSKALVLTLEYRSIANQYLSLRKIQNFDEIKLSPLIQVNQMLMADKIQNRKDFDLYHKGTHPRSNELEQYFCNWLKKLNISEEEYLKFCLLIEENKVQ
jgi:hypothetical protein